MKKTLRKLVLRSEALRTLATMDLVRAVGGLNSGAPECANQVFDSGPAVCDAPAKVIATGACH